MKYLFLAAVIFALYNFALAECDEKAQKILNGCYSKFTKSTGLKTPIVNKKLCSALLEHQECMQENKDLCRHVTQEELGKIFDTTPSNVFLTLFMENSLSYVCNHNYTATKEEEECVSTLSPKDVADCGDIEGCKDAKAYIKCWKEVMLKKCKNEEAVKVYTDAGEYAFKQMIPKCDI